MPSLHVRQISEHNQRHGVIYFLLSGPDQLIKIGFTSGDTSGDPLRRLKRVARAAKIDLEWIGYYRAQATDEITVHRHFRHLHVLNEWFRADPELMGWIKRKCPNFKVDLALEELFEVSLIKAIKAFTFGDHKKSLALYGHMKDIDYLDYARWRDRRRIPSPELLREARRALQGIDQAGRIAA
jgi:hypothetical protein